MEILEGFSVFGLGCDFVDCYSIIVLGILRFFFFVLFKRKVEVRVLGFVKGSVKSFLKFVYIFWLIFVKVGNKFF